MEVSALVYLEIVIIAASVAVSSGDSTLVLDRKVQESNGPRHLPCSIARDSRGWPWMSRTLTVAFPAHVY